MNERDKKNDNVEKIGDHDAKKKPNRVYVVYFISGFLLYIYGFLAFSNPIKYPILGGMYDKAIGLFFMMGGLVLFLCGKE